MKLNDTKYTTILNKYKNLIALNYVHFPIFLEVVLYKAPQKGNSFSAYTCGLVYLINPNSNFSDNFNKTQFGYKGTRLPVAV